MNARNSASMAGRVAVALAVVFSLGLSSVAMAAGATISGKVVDEQGAVVAGVRVAVMPMPNRDVQPPAPPQNAEPKAAQDSDKGRGNGPGGPGGRQRPQPVAQGETDADGKFSLAEVPAGKYMLVAGGRDAPGVARQPIEVTEGQELSIDLTLKPRPQRQPGGGGGQPPAGN